MKKYVVTISVVGGNSFEVLAKNKSDAGDKVYEFSDEEILADLDFSIEIEEIESSD